jgi:hypothetical protein
MESYFKKVREYLFELEISISKEDEANQVFVIEKEEDGIKNMVIAIAEPLIIIEQSLFVIQTPSVEVYKTLLMKNRDIIHGALVLDDDGKTVIFRDTLEVSNLDLNEIQGSIESLSLLLGEFGQEILTLVK